MREYKAWINTLKGYACVCIFVGHFLYGLAYKAEWAEVIYGTCFPFVLNGTFAVALFCFISGYLTTVHIDSTDALFIAIIKRYLRFCIPFFVICLFICLYNLFFSYSKNAIVLSSVIANEWISSGMTDDFTLFDVFFQPFIGILFLGTNKFALPTWMIRPMFFSQVFLMMYDYMRKKIVPVSKNKYRLDLLIFAFIFSVINYTFSAVFLGYWYKSQENNFRDINKRNCYRRIICTFVIAHIIQLYSTGLNTKMFGFINIIIAMILVHNVNSIGGKFVDNYIGRKLGNISFPVYLLHMPVIHVFSCYLIIQLLGFRFSYDIILGITFAITLLILFVFCYLWERLINPLVNNVTACIISRIRITISHECV